MIFPSLFSLNSEEAKSTTWLHPISGEAVITGHRKTPGKVSPYRQVCFFFSVPLFNRRSCSPSCAVVCLPLLPLKKRCFPQRERGCDTRASFHNAWVGFRRSCCLKKCNTLPCPPLCPARATSSWASAPSLRSVSEVDEWTLACCQLVQRRLSRTTTRM